MIRLVRIAIIFLGLFWFLLFVLGYYNSHHLNRYIQYLQLNNVDAFDNFWTSVKSLGVLFLGVITTLFSVVNFNHYFFSLACKIVFLVLLWYVMIFHGLLSYLDIEFALARQIMELMAKAG